MIRIFSDGSSKGNPGPGGWGVIVASQGHVEELGGGNPHTTNNRMEITAIIEALRFVGQTNEDITLYTDSKYTIDGITKWVSGWQKNGWKTKNKTEVLNRDLWEILVSLVQGKNITWHHVAGHVGIPGNERVDTIANSFAGGFSPGLYSGLEKDYRVSLSQTGASFSSQASKGKTAFSYIALVDGTIHRFQSWDACEKFVKGKNAKFRKALSKDHEQEILKDWGVIDR